MAHRDGPESGVGLSTQPLSPGQRAPGWFLRRWGRLLPLVATLLTALALVGVSTSAHADAPHVSTIHFAAEVAPASARYVTGAIDRAQSDGSALVVIELDTPGGDLDSMNRIIESELASKVPIAVYISPSGGHAASAGALVALAAPIVAMAPDTRIGASSPVSFTGEDLPATLRTKVTNDLSAQIRRLQQSYGRNPDPAEKMVTAATALDDQQAVQQNVVNLSAPALSDLLSRIDSQSVTLSNGTTTTLNLAGLPVEPLDPTLRDQIDAVLLDPNVLFLIFIIAAVCIYLELAHPGAIVPGTVGGIALLVFLYGAGSLSPNWAGLALMLLAIILLAVDVRAPTHGVLTVGALISLVAGSLIFFNTGPADQAVNPWIVVGVAVSVGVLAVVVLRYALMARRGKVDTGREALIGQVATVIVPLAPDGRVRVLGEDWSATLVAPGKAGAMPDRVEKGARVRVVDVQGLRLRVRPEDPSVSQLS